MIETFYFHDQTLQTELTLDELRDAKASQGILWINLRSPTDEEIEQVLQGIFSFHPLTIEDCRHVSKYPKIDLFKDYCFLVMLSPKTTVPAQAQLFMREIEIYLLPRVIVTCHREQLAAIRRLRDQLSKDEGQLLKRGTIFVLHLLLDTLADRYLTTAKAIKERSEALELPSRNCDGEALAEVLDLKTSSLALAKVVEQTKDCLARLSKSSPARVDEDSAPYFSDLDDHLKRALNVLELSQKRLSGNRDLYFAGARQRSDRALWTLGLLGFGALVIYAAIVAWKMFNE